MLDFIYNDYTDRPELLSDGPDVDFVKMTNWFMICCKKLPPIFEMCMFSIWEGVLFYVSSLLRTSAHRHLRNNFLVLEVLEVCVALL